MIVLLTGTLAARDDDELVVLTDAGVGYAVSVPLETLTQLPPVGARVTLHTELVVREDSWSLFGFAQPAEREVFRRLLGASGFGPRLALALLSTLGADRVVRAVKGKDLAALSSVPGIGRKKAERLVLELSDKLDDVSLPPTGAVPTGGAADDAVRALTRLGYTPAQAGDAVRIALAGKNGVDAATLVKSALQLLVSVR